MLTNCAVRSRIAISPRSACARTSRQQEASKETQSVRRGRRAPAASYRRSRTLHRRSGGHALPELFHAVEPGARAWRMRRAVVAKTLLELLQQFALRLREFDRRLDDHAADEVADVTAAHVLDALAAQLEQLAGLRLRRNLDRG